MNQMQALFRKMNSKQTRLALFHDYEHSACTMNGDKEIADYLISHDNITDAYTQDEDKGSLTMNIYNHHLQMPMNFRRKNLSIVLLRTV